MRVGIATTAADELGGAFARAYHAAGGPEPVAILQLPPRADLEHPWWAVPWTAWRLFGFTGTSRIAAARYLRRPVTRADAELGLADRWPVTMAGTRTRMLSWPTLRTTADADRLRALELDVLVSIGVPTVLPERILECARWGCVNVHNGRLPRYRGHFGTFWEIRQGERSGGVTVHRMVAKVDAGEILAAGEVPFAGCTSLLDVLLRKKALGGRLLAEVLSAAREIGGLASGTAVTAETVRAYGWPSLRDVRAFAFPSRAAER